MGSGCVSWLKDRLAGCCDCTQCLHVRRPSNTISRTEKAGWPIEPWHVLWKKKVTVLFVITASAFPGLRVDAFQIDGVARRIPDGIPDRKSDFSRTHESKGMTMGMPRLCVKLDTPCKHVFGGRHRWRDSDIHASATGWWTGGVRNEKTGIGTNR